MFDDLILLSEGRLMYSGAAGKVTKRFRSLGYSMPPNTNPGDFAIDLVSIDYSSKESEQESRERVNKLALDDDAIEDGDGQSLITGTGALCNTPPLPKKISVRNASETNGEISDSKQSQKARLTFKGARKISRASWRGGRRDKEFAWESSAEEKRAGLLEQFRLLMSRSWRQVNRSKFANITRVLANLGSAVIFGAIYWKLGLGQTQINDRLGLLQTAAIQCAMSTVIKTLITFPAESNIVKAERSLKLYNVLPYFSSKIIAELPISALFPNIFGVILYQMTGLHAKRDRFLRFLGILTMEAFAASALGMLVGAVAKNEDAALALGPPVMTVFILFSGFYIAQDNIPKVLRWIKEASIIKHAFEGFCVNELTGLQFQCDTKSRGPCIQTGEQMLARVAFDRSTVGGAVVNLGKIVGGCWVMTYIALVLSSPRFQPMIDPSRRVSTPGLDVRTRGGGIGHDASVVSRVGADITAGENKTDLSVSDRDIKKEKFLRSIRRAREKIAWEEKAKLPLEVSRAPKMLLHHARTRSTVVHHTRRGRHALFAGNNLS